MSDENQSLVGCGLNSDGHKRVTKGEHFVLTGGTQETHERMVEYTLKMREKLKKRGKDFRSASREEFDDVAHSVGLKRGDELTERE